MVVRQVIPEDLAQLAPGPGLAAVLAGIDLSRLAGYDCVEVVKARYRQNNHERARLMAAVVESALCALGPNDELPRRATPDRFAADEVRAALVLTRRAAEGLFWLAYDLVSRLPGVWAAMDEGWCDEPRARILSEWTAELSGEHARAVCSALLPRLGELTTGALIEAIKTHAIALDPDWAQRRYEQALADRKIVGRRNPDGSANLAGYNLPVDRVAAAAARIDTLAKAAKHAGDTRPIDHLRADLYLGMVDGGYVGLDDTTILSLLLAADTGRTEPGVGADSEPAEPGHDGADGAGDGGEGGGEGSADDRPDEGDGGSGDGPAGPGGGPAPGGGVRSRGLELRVRLSTLLDCDDCPAELAGWGPVHAGLARDLAATLERGQWRFAIVDEQGRLLTAGITRARPTVADRVELPPRAGDVVELQVPAGLLAELAAADRVSLGIWRTVIADLARQQERAEADRATSTNRPDGGDPDCFAGDAARRMPGAAQRRYLQLRDRRCVGVGCRAPARGADADHTRDHARGGPSLPGNLGHLCKHDHLVKHEGGWRLDQPEPGLFRWTSRLGQRYTVRPPPIIEPLPDPQPSTEPLYSIWIPPDDNWQDSLILQPPPPEPEPPPPLPDPDDDPPPF
jgi:hypothetical protein